MPKNESTESPAAVTFEQAIAQLEAIVHELEEGQVGLEESLARYEQGVKLLRRCHELLSRAQRRIELLSGVDAQGAPVTRPMEEESGTLEQKAARRSRRRSAEPTPDKTTEGRHSGDSGESADGPPDVDETGRLF
jgi:exodeoxyribonuclease VII small subunit